MTDNKKGTNKHVDAIVELHQWYSYHTNGSLLFDLNTKLPMLKSIFETEEREEKEVSISMDIDQTLPTQQQQSKDETKKEQKEREREKKKFTINGELVVDPKKWTSEIAKSTTKWIKTEDLLTFFSVVHAMNNNQNIAVMDLSLSQYIVTALMKGGKYTKPTKYDQALIVEVARRLTKPVYKNNPQKNKEEEKKRINPFRLKTWLIPVNYDDLHWYLIGIRMDSGFVYIWDSNYHLTGECASTSSSSGQKYGKIKPNGFINRFLALVTQLHDYYLSNNWLEDVIHRCGGKDNLTVAEGGDWVTMFHSSEKHTPPLLTFGDSTKIRFVLDDMPQQTDFQESESHSDCGIWIGLLVKYIYEMCSGELVPNLASDFKLFIQNKLKSSSVASSSTTTINNNKKEVSLRLREMFVSYVLNAPSVLPSSVCITY